MVKNPNQVWPRQQPRHDFLTPLIILEVALDEPLIVSKYIENPLLINGHKSDLRLYVLVTSYDPLVIYLYEEGLVRFAAVKYDGGNLWNPCIHVNSVPLQLNVRSDIYLVCSCVTAPSTNTTPTT